MAFDLPPYPYDLLEPYRLIASKHAGGVVDLSVGTPCDPPPPLVVNSLAESNSERGYPPSVGSQDFRNSCQEWVRRRFDVRLDTEKNIGACIGTKEFVVSTPNYLRLRSPDKDTVLYPEVSYPSYAMGAHLSGCRAVPVAIGDNGQLLLSDLDPRDIERALMLWVNSPSNPSGVLCDLDAIADWGRANEIPIFSDECYAEFTWSQSPQTILNNGLSGVVAVHSLSKRSNLAGIRAGFYAGDEDLVHWLKEIRKHSGKMVPGPVQTAAALAYSDDDHVEEQRMRYKERLEFLQNCLNSIGINTNFPDGAFYLWVASGSAEPWHLVERLATEVGVLVAPGTFFGSSGHVRVAAVQTLEKLSLITDRISN
ncbi:MAG: succinyldiaminopimelate transaminase [Acidimicrobiaceae bacterium]|nr:succinyldiaminopimelate transaminase [Acidimicrobiaceae bacterium]